MKTLLLQPDLGTRDREIHAARAEAESLVHALNLDVFGAMTVPVSKVDPGRYFGSGKLDEIGRTVLDDDIGLIVVNAQLSPVQQRNLERGWKAKVLDRTGLILEIFGDRAKTREGVLQVELAHLAYQRSRLVRSWTHLERQRGGRGFMGGPGERQIEADRRAIDDTIVRLKRQLEKVVKTRTLHRSARKKVPFPVVALVGYTNAGKSTIFNTLTGASVVAKDMVFATLDPTMRAYSLPSGRDVILSDTVGFITDLPTELIAAFRATLEEVRDADVILHVRDISSPETDLQSAKVLEILEDLGAGTSHGQEVIEVWNKIDRVDPLETARLVGDRVAPGGRGPDVGGQWRRPGRAGGQGGGRPSCGRGRRDPVASPECRSCALLALSGPACGPGSGAGRAPLSGCSLERSRTRSVFLGVLCRTWGLTG